jgi:corrinoid protein of di/trimethylamine methyltransferase
MSTKDVLFQELINGVVEFEDEKVVESARKIIDSGYDPVEAVLKGLSAGMMRVGELFAAQDYFVPEVLLCADAMEAGLAVLRPHIPVAENAGDKPKVLLATVEGDVHDIGKNMVKLMLDVNGYTVHDLGADVPLDKIVAEQKNIDAKIVGLSAMMTTTMMAMKKVIPLLKENSPDVKILVGGAPVTRDVAKLFGADGYADDAPGAVMEANRITAELQQ